MNWRSDGRFKGKRQKVASSLTHRPPSLSFHSCRAFSLLELLLVMAIMALGFVFIAPNFANTLEGVRYRAAVREVASGLRQVRGIALSQGREAVFFVDVEERLYRIDRQTGKHRLPDFMELTLVTAETELTGPEKGNIRFYPDGSATGGGIILTWGPRRRRVNVNWLTGRVTIEEIGNGE